MSLETHERLEPLAAEWDELVDRVRAVPWLRPGWIGAWWRAFGRGSLRVLAVRRGDELAGVLPLALHRGVLSSPTNWHTPEFGLVALEPEHREELARAAFGQRRRRVTLSFLERDAGLREVEAAAAAAGYRTLVRVRERSPYVALDGSLDEYLGTLDRKHAKEIRRVRRRLEEQGEVAFEVEETAERLDELLRLEAVGWKGESETAIVSRPETLAFYRDVAAWAAASGTLRLAFLRLDGRPIAAELLVEEHGVLYDLKGGYDEAYRKLAPGNLIVGELIAHAFRRGLRSYELLGSDEPFKLAWTSRVRERLHFDAFSPRPAGAAEFAAQAYGRRLARRVLELARRP